MELLIEITERYNNSSPPTALEFAKQSLDLLETHPDPGALARVTHQMCWAYQNLGDYRTALNWCNRSAAVAESTDNKNALARALNTTGVVFWRLADYDRSIDFLLRALELEEKHGTPFSQSQALNNIGIVQAAMGNYDSALEFYEHSLEIKEREDDTRGIANVLNNMAGVYRKLDRLDTALDLHQRSLALKQELGYDVGAITSHIQIGMIYSAQGVDDLALASFLEALRLADKTGVRANQSTILTQLGVLDRKAGRLDPAIEKTDSGARSGDGDRIPGRRFATRRWSWPEPTRLWGTTSPHSTTTSNTSSRMDEIFSAESRDRIAQLEVREEINRREAEIRRQRMVRTALLIGLAGLTVLLLVALRAYRLKTQANLVIHRTNKKLEAVDRIVTSINSEVEFDGVLETILSEVNAIDGGGSRRFSGSRPGSTPLRGSCVAGRARRRVGGNRTERVRDR